MFLRKPDAAPTEGTRSYRATALASVMPEWYASCILPRLEKEKEPESGRICILVEKKDKLPTLASNGDELDTKTLGMARRKESCDETRNVRPTMYMASLDIKTAFDEPKPKHVAKIMDGHNTQGWIIATFLREMSGLSGKAIFGCVETSFAFNRCLRPLWRKNG